MPTTTLTEAAQALFADYPQAVRSVNCDGSVRTMVLLVRDGSGENFLTLVSQDDGDPSGPFFDVSRWREADRIDLDGESIEVPAWASDAVTRGIPLPRDGALYGWTNHGRVTTLIPFYARWTPEHPLPSWSLMLDADVTDWPPFTGEHLLGPWLWEHYRAGRIVDLGGLIADSPGAVFWATAVAPLEWGCCAVARDLAGPDGWILPRGRYVYHGELRDGKTAPPLEALLADPGATDLAPRFQGP